MVIEWSIKMRKILFSVVANRIVVDLGRCVEFLFMYVVICMLWDILYAVTQRSTNVWKWNDRKSHSSKACISWQCHFNDPINWCMTTTPKEKRRNRSSFPIPFIHSHHCAADKKERPGRSQSNKYTQRPMTRQIWALGSSDGNWKKLKTI